MQNTNTMVWRLWNLLVAFLSAIWKRLLRWFEYEKKKNDPKEHLLLSKPTDTSPEDEEGSVVAIFWDYESIPILPQINPATIHHDRSDSRDVIQMTQAILKVALSHGRIVERRFYHHHPFPSSASYNGRNRRLDKPSSYYDWTADKDITHAAYMTQQQQQQEAEEEVATGIHACGFDIMSCTNSMTLKQKLMIDMMTFAWDRTNSSGCVKIIVLANDVDYAYALSKLKDRGVETVLIYQDDDNNNNQKDTTSGSINTFATTATPLVYIADLSISLHEILSQTLSNDSEHTENQIESTIKSTTTNVNASTADSIVPITKEESATATDPLKSTTTESQSLESTLSPKANQKEFARNLVGELTENQTLILQRQELDYVLVFCQTVKRVWEKNQSKSLSKFSTEEGSAGRSSSGESDWVMLSAVAAQMQQSIRKILPLPTTDCKTITKKARMDAESCNFIEFGRRALSSSEKMDRVIVPTSTNLSDQNHDQSTEMHVRLTPNGKDYLRSNETNMSIVHGDDDDKASSQEELMKQASGSNHTIPSSDPHEGEVQTIPSTRRPVSEDVIVLCHCLHDELRRVSNRPSKHSEWLFTGMIELAFHSLFFRRRADGAIYNKEIISKRFKEARESAIRQGFAEMGRKRLITPNPNPDFLPISKMTKEAITNGCLSTETYMRLLPAGKQLDHFPLNIPEKTVARVESGDALADRYLFCSNFPPNVRISEILDFFEGTLRCPVEQMELEHYKWDNKPTIAAHIRFVSPDSLRFILKIVNHRDRLRYCEQIIFATLDFYKSLRAILARKGDSNKEENMSYQRTVDSVLPGSVNSSE